MHISKCTFIHTHIHTNKIIAGVSYLLDYATPPPEGVEAAGGKGMGQGGGKRGWVREILKAVRDVTGKKVIDTPPPMDTPPPPPPSPALEGEGGLGGVHELSELDLGDSR